MIRNDTGFSHAGLYIHIPFCRSKCAYCDFNSFSGIDYLAPAYVKAVLRELAGWSALAQSGQLPSTAPQTGRLDVRTVYFGGGTPTLLDGEAIAAILSTCRTAFRVASDAEITIEGNPGTLNDEKLRGLRAAGVNRLSIGAQSFNPKILKLLGRIHSNQETLDAYAAARRAGFANVNLDFIYGIPTQSMADWQEDLLRAIDLAPAHLSLYGLSVEDGTPLSVDIGRGRLNPPDPDLAADMYVWAEETLKDSGYDHYEISNWAIPGARCQHNLIYWHNVPYIGVGAGAHSSFCSVRLANTSDPMKYVENLTAGPDPVAGEATAGGFIDAARRLCAVDQVDELDLTTQMAETAILGLRLTEGVDAMRFHDRFGVDLDPTFGPAVFQLADIGLIEERDGCITLTPKGRLLGNEVFMRLLPA